MKTNVAIILNSAVEVIHLALRTPPTTVFGINIFGVIIAHMSSCIKSDAIAKKSETIIQYFW